MNAKDFNYIALDLSKLIDEFITALSIVCQFTVPVISLLKPIISTALENYDEEVVSRKIFLLLTSSELIDPFHRDYEVIKELTNLFVSLIKIEMINNGIIEDEQQNYFVLSVRKSGLTIIGHT